MPPFSTPASRAVSAGPADPILKNGKIYTVDPAFSIVQAIAVKDGLIEAVGDDLSVAGMAGDNTQVIDLGGKVVTPGLIDGHVHFRAIGLQFSYYTPFMPAECKRAARRPATGTRR